MVQADLSPSSKGTVNQTRPGDVTNVNKLNKAPPYTEDLSKLEVQIQHKFPCVNPMHVWETHLAPHMSPQFTVGVCIFPLIKTKCHNQLLLTFDQAASLQTRYNSSSLRKCGYQCKRAANAVLGALSDSELMWEILNTVSKVNEMTEVILFCWVFSVEKKKTQTALKLLKYITTPLKNPYKKEAYPQKG